MAKLSKRGTHLLIEVVNEHGGVVWALRSDAHILKRRPGGAGHLDAGRCKPDLTIGRIVEILTPSVQKKGFTLRVHAEPDRVPNPAAKHAASVNAREKRAAVEREATARAQAREAALQLPAEELASLADRAADVTRYCIEAARAGERPRDGRLAYVVGMAKFHGSPSGYLGTAYQAAWSLPRDYGFREELDTMADAVARAVYGSDMRAAARWHRAFHG